VGDREEGEGSRAMEMVRFSSKNKDKRGSSLESRGGFDLNIFDIKTTGALALGQSQSQK
jgi:hypothetical protein